jgi:hypothetical protein
MRPGKPSQDHEPLHPGEGFRITTYRDVRAGIAVPVLIATVARGRVFDLFLSLLDPLGETVDVIVEKNGKSLCRPFIDLPVFKSYCCDFEDLLREDGGISIVVDDSDGTMEVLFDQHKRLFIYARDLCPFERIVKQAGLVRDDDLRGTAPGERFPRSGPRLARRFEQFCYRLGVGEITHQVSC